MPHVGVMKEEISSLLKDVPEGYFIDATYGDGSHFEFIDSEKNLFYQNQTIKYLNLP